MGKSPARNMAASSSLAAGWIHLCLIVFLSVLSSAQRYIDLDTPAQVDLDRNAWDHQHLLFDGLEGLAVPRVDGLVGSNIEAPELAVSVEISPIDDGCEDCQPDSNDMACENNPASESPVFNCLATDWTSEDERRICLARIVSTVYCGGKNSTALRLSLLGTGFRLHGEPLKDDGDIYAAIFKYDGEGPTVKVHGPDIVVAFRGTQMCLKWRAVKDNILNIMIGVKAEKYATRFKDAYEKVKDLIASGKHHRVWLTGHSQGASLALQVGRGTRLNENISLTTVAFNPPVAFFCWFPQRAKGLIDIVMPSNPTQTHHILSEWTPELYIHNKDLFCSPYIRCLKQPAKLDKLVLKMPSTKMCVNSGKVQGRNRLKQWLEAHKLDLWFEPHTNRTLNCEAVKTQDGYRQDQHAQHRTGHNTAKSGWRLYGEYFHNGYTHDEERCYVRPTQASPLH
uniref:Uncharacterized protein n=1 Tax=Avena sativa TaxID=4498 RepID=A0ACD5Y608_AVESA